MRAPNAEHGGEEGTVLNEALGAGNAGRLDCRSPMVECSLQQRNFSIKRNWTQKVFIFFGRGEELGGYPSRCTLIQDPEPKWSTKSKEI